MAGEQLDRLVEDERLDLNPNKFDSDEDLQDEICKLLRIEKDDGESRQGRMTQRRERG